MVRLSEPYEEVFKIRVLRYTGKTAIAIHVCLCKTSTVVRQRITKCSIVGKRMAWVSSGGQKIINGKKKGEGRCRTLRNARICRKWLEKNTVKLGGERSLTEAT